MTASGDPAAEIRFPISSWLTALALKVDLWDWEAEESDEMAESMDDVRGMTRCPGRSPAMECRELMVDMGEGEDVTDWTESVVSEIVCDFVGFTLSSVMSFLS